MINVFIEPARVFADRQAQRLCTVEVLPGLPGRLGFDVVLPARPPPALPPPRDDLWTALVFEVLRENGDEAVRITSLVNAVARLGNFSRRDDRIAKKIELFRLIGKLIRLGRLDRVARRYVAIPKTDERRCALQASLPQPCDLPAPNV